MTNVSFITGINGQDGSYLAEFLLDKGYFVYGLVRRSSIINTTRLDPIFNHPRLKLMYGDITDLSNLVHCLETIKQKHPETEKFEIYNLCAQSHVKVSFEEPIYTGQVDAIGTLNLLEAMRITGLASKARFYQASTSELYGKVQEIPQKETTPFYPRSPYGVAKLYGFWIVKNYRESYGMYACSGILFNHESERRGETFVTRKITIGIGKILRGESDCIYIGNLDAKRDWGHAKDYVRGIWMILQPDTPDDYVLSTNECHSVREFIEKAFSYVNITIRWEGEGVNEVGIDDQSGKVLVRIAERYFRPAEVELLLGDSTKARETLGWKPEISFDELVKLMVDHDR